MTRAQTSHVQIGTPAGRERILRTKIDVVVLIIRLEDADGEMMADAVIQTAAGCQCRTPGVWLLEGTAKPNRARLKVHERGHVFSRIAEHDTA